MTTDRDQILSEFMDAWNAGQRPDIQAYTERAPADQQAALREDLATYLTWAPTPDFDDDTLSAIRAEPIVAEVRAAAHARTGLWPTLLPRLRARLSITTGQLATGLVETLGLPAETEGKTRAYVEQMESGTLEPTGVSRRVIDALARVLGVPTHQLESDASFGLWAQPPQAAASMAFRAEDEIAETVREDLDLLHRAAQLPSEREWDEVDVLFRGGR